MAITITARNALVTDEIKDYAREKLESLEHLWPRDADARLVIESERVGYFLEISLQSGRNIIITSQARNRNLQPAINEAVRKLERQLKRLKEKTYQRRVEKVQVPYGPEDLPEDIPLLIKIPAALIEVLDERAASLRMRGGHLPFLIYREQATGQLSVIFRREDGVLGLMEIPEK